MNTGIQAMKFQAMKFQSGAMLDLAFSKASPAGAGVLPPLGLLAVIFGIAWPRRETDPTAAAISARSARAFSQHDEY